MTWINFALTYFNYFENTIKVVLSVKLYATGEKV